MRRALGATALVAALVTLTSCGGGQGPPVQRSPAQPAPVQRPPVQRFKPVVDRNFFGVNGTQLRELAADPNPGSRAILEEQVAAIGNAGLGWVRAVLDWSTIEPFPPLGRRHRHDFTKYDPWVEALARHKLTWQPILMHPPDWTTDPKRRTECTRYDRATPPIRSRDMASFAAAIAGRYGANGSFWSEHGDLPRRPVQNFEIWNEPNLTSFWCPVIEPAVYADLYLAARNAIHAVDPQAHVVLGGLAFQPGQGLARQLKDDQPVSLGVEPFLRAMLAAQPSLRGKIDIVGVHAYADDPQHLFKAIALDRKILRQVGLGTVPMLFNESGWYTRGSSSFLQPISNEQRAKNYRELVGAVARTNCNITGFAAQTWRTAEQNPNDLEDWWGLAGIRGSLNAAGKGYRDAVWLMRGHGSEPPLRTELRYCG